MGDDMMIFDIGIVVDADSWFVPYAEKLRKLLIKQGHKVTIANDHREITSPKDIVFILSYGKIVEKQFLLKNKHNIVVHESDLPQGKGWSPLTWQILDGKNKIPITLFEADEKVDSGVIYLQDTIELKGHELTDEIREQQAQKTINLIAKFIKSYVNSKGKTQQGQETFYPRRTPKDSELNPDKTIREQFNLLRVVDNERYPAFFNYKGHKYLLKIYKAKNKN